MSSTADKTTLSYLPCSHFLKGRCQHSGDHTITTTKGDVLVGHYNPKLTNLPECKWYMDGECNKKTVCGCHLITRSDGVTKMVVKHTEKTDYRATSRHECFMFPTGADVMKVCPCCAFNNPMKKCRNKLAEHDISTADGKTFTVAHYHPRQECRSGGYCEFCKDIPTCPDPKCHRKLNDGCHLFIWSNNETTVVYHPRTDMETTAVLAPVVAYVPSVPSVPSVSTVHAKPFVPFDPTKMTWGDMCDE